MTAFVLVALFLASVAAPGLTMHNCRQFGTRSTALCDCCNDELDAAKGCCASKSNAVAPVCHDPVSDSQIESACCFTSYESPFAFAGLNSSQVSVPTSDEQGATLAPADVAMECAYTSFAISYSFEQAHRHSSDPPSYILTHSFRC